MALTKNGKKAKLIRESLVKQLRDIRADVAHFRDLVEDYVWLVGVKDLLLEDIRVRGVMYTDVSSVGVEMQKNNPSIKELTSVNRQMLAILKELGLNTNNVAMCGDDDAL